MPTIKDFLNKYYQKIDNLDLELLIAATINQPREFVLTHPEYVLTKNYELKIKNYVKRRIKHEPLAYILGKKEFYGLEFKVNKNTLIPRPETEQIVELALDEIFNFQVPIFNLNIIDVGTGSGNIIISIAKAIENLTSHTLHLKFIGIDISTKALAIAKQNAKKYKLDKKINFLQGNLLEPLIKNCSLFHVPCSMVIVANLPYLSYKIYNSTSKDVKNYEPKSALYSSRYGLNHYQKLLKQLAKIKKKCSMFHVSCFMEISPEQKTQLKKAFLTVFPQSHPIFFKDLSGRFRVARIKL